MSTMASAGKDMTGARMLTWSGGKASVSQGGVPNLQFRQHHLSDNMSFLTMALLVHADKPTPMWC